MRKFILLVALGLIAALIIAVSAPVRASAPLDGPSPIASGTHVFGGPEVPFPLDEQVDFPWSNIEGIWYAKGGGLNAMFSFRIQSDSMNNRILQVTQLNANSEVVAQGTGYSADDARLVRAGMVIQASGKNYWLIIRAFKSDKTGRVETVLTLRPFGGNEDSDVHIVVRKLTSVPFDGGSPKNSRESEDF